MRFIWWYADACFCPVCRYSVPFHHLLLLPAWYCWVFRCYFLLRQLILFSWVILLFQRVSLHPSQKSQVRHASTKETHILLLVLLHSVSTVRKKGCFRNKNINVSVKYRNKNTNTQIDTDTMENIGTFIKINTITLTYLCGLQHQFSFSIRTFGHIDTGWWVYIILFFCFNILWLGESPWAKFNMYEIQ